MKEFKFVFNEEEQNFISLSLPKTAKIACLRRELLTLPYLQETESILGEKIKDGEIPLFTLQFIKELHQYSNIDVTLYFPITYVGKYILAEIKIIEEGEDYIPFTLKISKM